MKREAPPLIVSRYSPTVPALFSGKRRLAGGSKERNPQGKAV
jgi:hypothetical protein